MKDILQIPQDDIDDIQEMSKRIEEFTLSVLKDNKDSNAHISMSALMSASINSMLEMCKSKEEIINNYKSFIVVLNLAIENLICDK